MSAIVSLSRPGLCAGRLPLQLLISKLLRFGEHTAAASLQSLPLAYQRRVRWTLCGTSLTIEADGSRAACGALSSASGRTEFISDRILPAPPNGQAGGSAEGERATR